MSDCEKLKKVEIFKGGRKTFRIFVKSGDFAKDLSGLTGTQITVKLALQADTSTTLDVTLTPNVNGSVVTIFNGPSGIIDVTLNEADTLLLNEGDDLDMEIIVDDGGGPEKDQILNSVDVIGDLFS